VSDNIKKENIGYPSKG